MKNETSNEPSYNDFEPCCLWKKEPESSIFKGTEILEIHLPGFKKEELKTEFGKDGFLYISGERPDGRCLKRFNKKIDVSKCDPKDVEAEFKDGLLRIRLPSKSSAFGFSFPRDNETVGILVSCPKKKATKLAVAAVLLFLLAFYAYKYSECTNFRNWFT